MKKIIILSSVLGILSFLVSCKKENTNNDKASVNNSKTIDTLKLLTNDSVKKWKCVSKITCGSHSCPNHILPEISFHNNFKLDHLEYDFDGKCGQTKETSSILWQLKKGNVLAFNENDCDLIDHNEYIITKITNDSLHLKWYTNGCTPNQSVLQESLWVAN
jgi:hypothetical protein